MATTGEKRLRDALLAVDSGTLAALPGSSFESVHPEPVNICLSVRSSAEFTSHTSFDLPPLDSSCTEGVRIHRFVLRASSKLLNEGLKEHALTLERRAAGVQVSNRGGFQSGPTLFDAPEEHCDEKDEVGHLYGQELHGLASRAINEIDGVAVNADGEFVNGDALAWLNVNRASDVNLMHTHAANRWSGIYYADAGESPSAAAHVDGRLLFRFGATQCATHSYIAIAPVAVSLWI